MDTIVRKMIVTLALCVCLVRCEPPALSSQYGVPGNFAGPQGGYQQQQQQQQQQGGVGYQTGVTNSYGAPLGGDGGGGGGHGGHGNGHDEQQDYIDNQPKSYEFGYAVKDEASGNDFGRRETSDGETVRGEYRVQLPDGRTQIVTYTADWRTGFHADVRYEGEAQYPDQYNNGNQAGYNANAQGQNYNNNNNINNNNNQGYNNNNGGNNFNNGGYDYAGSNNIDTGYNNNNNNNNNNAGGNHGGYNNYQANQGYNSAGNGGYNYQYPSNSIDGGNGGYFGPSAAPPPQQAYGVPFH